MDASISKRSNGFYLINIILLVLVLYVWFSKQITVVVLVEQTKTTEILNESLLWPE